MTTGKRAQVIDAFKRAIESEPTLFGVAPKNRLRMLWEVSETTAAKVLSACLIEQAAIDPDAPPRSQWAFRKRVKERLRRGNDLDGRPFGIDPFTILLIFKLILLFIELWMKFSTTPQGQESCDPK